jgi:hypothetical protein
MSQKFNAKQRSKTFWDKAFLYLFLVAFSFSFLAKQISAESSSHNFLSFKQVVSKGDNSQQILSESLYEGEECLDDDNLDHENDFSDAILHSAFAVCFSQIYVWADWNLNFQIPCEKRFIELRVLRI